MEVREENQATMVIATASGCLAVTTIMVTVRLYTRFFLVRQVGLDDWLAAVTLVLIFGVGIGMTLNIDNGLGRHLSVLSDTEVHLYKRSLYASMVLYTSALLSVKATLLTQYYRLFSVQAMRSVYLGAFILVVCWSVSQVLLAVLACLPVSAFWDNSVTDARCLPAQPLLYVNAAGNIATELAVLALPLPVLGTLNLPLSQRVMLIGIFSLGFLTVIISIIRIQYLKDLADYTYQAVPLACLSLAELTSALTCACLLTLRPIITRAAPQAPQLAQEHKRGSYLRHSTASTFVRSSSSYSRSHSQPMPHMGSSAAVRYLVSMQSREGLYDDKYMLTKSSYELELSPASETQTPQSAIVAAEKHHPWSSLDAPETVIAITAQKPRKKRSLGKFDAMDREIRHTGWSSRRKPKTPAKGSEWIADLHNIKSSVTTEIDNRGAVVKPEGKPTPKWEIGVETTVHQSYQSTYMSTAVRC